MTAFWTERSRGRKVLRFADLEPSGRRFGPVRTLLRDASNIRRTDLTWGIAAASDTAGRVTVAWQRTGPLGWQLELVTRSRGGRFSAPVVVAASRRRLHSLQVRAEASGAAAIIWTAREPGEVAEYCGGVFGGRGFPACEGVWATVRRGGDWLPSRRLAITNELNFPLANAGPDGTFVTVLTDAGGLELFRAAPGHHFSDPVRLASGNRMWSSGVDLTPGGHAVVAWREDEDPAVVAAPRRLNRAATVAPDGSVSPLNEVLITAYSPLAHGRVPDDQTLRWIGESRRENFEIFDFDLGQPERDEIDLLPTDVRTANPPWAPDWNA